MTHGVPCLKCCTFKSTRAGLDPIDAVEPPHSCHHFLRGMLFRPPVFWKWRPCKVDEQRFAGKSYFSIPRKFPPCRRVCLKIPGFKILYDGLMYWNEFLMLHPTSCHEVMQQQRLKVFLSFGVPCLTFWRGTMSQSIFSNFAILNFAFWQNWPVNVFEAISFCSIALQSYLLDVQSGISRSKGV